MTEKVFAPTYLRNEQGWIKFPRNDRAERTKLFGEEVMGHPAMLNMFVEQEIIDYVSEEEDVLLDPMSGSGTLMMAALFNRRAICIELEEHFHNLQLGVKERIAGGDEEIANRITLLHGDCRFFLPIPCNHIIFSPPYAQAMNIKRIREVKEGSDNYFALQDARMLEYSKSPRNISKLNTFLYNQEMKKIYRLCWESLLPGGTMTIIIKDRTKGDDVVELSKWVNKVCLEAGFELKDWFKWEATGTMFTNVRRSKGQVTVDCEEIMMYRRAE
jgi:DNA modification methylase